MQAQRQFSRIIPHAESDSQSDRSVEYSKEFGYSRKDVLIIIVGLIGLGVVMYEGLQAMGMDAGIAGNWVQATIFLGICVGWVSTYLWRVANKVGIQRCSSSGTSSSSSAQHVACFLHAELVTGTQDTVVALHDISSLWFCQC